MSTFLVFTIGFVASLVVILANSCVEGVREMLAARRTIAAGELARWRKAAWECICGGLNDEGARACGCGEPRW